MNTGVHRTIATALLVHCMALLPVSVAAASSLRHADRIDWPDSMRLTVISDGMQVNGVETRILAFQSADSVAALAAHFDRSWNGRMKRAQAGPWEVLSHRRNDVLTTVQIKVRTLGGTYGYISFSNLFEVLGSGLATPRPDIPVLPRTQIQQLIDANDSGIRSRTRVLRSELSPTQQLDFYREHYRAAGFEPIGARALSRNEDGGAMVLNRGATQASVAAARRNGQTIVTIVTVHP